MSSLLAVISPILILICFYLVIIFWIFRTTKAVLFYLYLWQLKEYHVGRFLDHFRTAQGKRLLVNRVFLGKVIILIALIFSLWLSTVDFQISDFAASFLLFVAAAPFFALTALYTIDALRIQRSKRPVFTKKTILLFGVLFLGELLAILLVHQLSGYVYTITDWDLFASIFTYPIGLLVFDLLVPVFVSAVVLGFQPLAVIGRNRIIQKAKEKRAKLKKLKVVGITGSYGKTTTKEILAHILSQKFNVVKTPEHKNSEIGISQVILEDLTDEHDIFVCEMGAYNKGGIKLLAHIVKPDIGIVTGVNEQHLATFGSMENLLSAEGGRELIEALPKDGVVIINKNSRLHVDFDGQAKIKILTPDIPKVITAKDRISFEIDGQQVRLNVLGAHNAENFVLAAAAAKQLGMSSQEIAKACENITQEVGAMKLKKGVNGLNIIDSTYSANPDGVIAALEYLKVWRGRKIIVMPCLIELGKASKEVHRRIGEKIGEVCDLAIITTKDWFDELTQGAVSRGMEGGQILFQENPQKIFDMIKNINREEDVILLESRVPSTLLQLLELTAP